MVNAQDDSPALPRCPWAVIGVLVFAVAAAYANSLRAPFVYDDTLAIPDNPTIRSLRALPQVLWPQADGGLTVSGRPVLNLSFAVNYAVSGTAVWSYHVFNAGVHAGAALLLFGVVRRTLVRGAATHPKSAIRQTPTIAIALLIAALWALHPLQTQAVTYTVQRAESLMGFFYLLTLYAFARAMDFDRRSENGAAARRWLAASVGACALGMGTKEVTVTAPILVLLYDRTFVAGTFAAAWRARRSYYLALAATWLLLAALVLSTGGNRGGTVGLGVGLPLWAYPLTQFEALARYLALGAWPHPLVFEYGTRWTRDMTDWLPHALLILPALAATLVALRRWPAAGFLGAWFFLILAPTSLAPGTIQMIVEHRMYLPLAAMVSGGVLVAWRLAGTRALAALGAGAAALAVLTAARNHDYRSHLALWSDTVAKRPMNPRAHEGLAEALAAAGRHEEAIQVREKVVRLDPDDSRFRFNLALALANAGRTEDAVRHYRESLRQFPAEARTHNNLAILLVQLGRAEEALPHYAEAARLQPDAAAYRYNHGLALLRLNRAEDAVEHLAAAARLKPDEVAYALTHARALVRLRRFEEAITQLEALVRVAPDRADAHFQLANALLDVERVAAAIPHYEAAVRLSPRDAEAQHNLGVAHAMMEHWDEARRAFDEALRLKPDYPDARRSREQLRSVTGK